MKITRVPNIVRRIASIAIKIPGFRFLFRDLYKSYLKKIEANRNQVFRENAHNVLSEFDQVCVSNKIHYTVFAGTLLGAIRERGFLKHDLDIDVAMFYKDYNPLVSELLDKQGFKLFHSFEVKEGSLGREDTYIKNGVTIDIFYIYEDEKYPTYQCDFFSPIGTESVKYKKNEKCVRRNQFPIEYEVIRMPFEDFEVNVIKNYHEWLSARYGENYMIPDPNFRDKGDNPGIRVLDGVKAVMKTY